ncbi:hypothetical protein [Microbacterium allomyrinae]|uniref:Protein kinase domain-containing protein n=1 Tax=Microbacterium allomyrinae TaxID=2830666 RepID=A0A9X1LVR3_9MICO|nr:hypothetical protein [Microbacterium allomyrinae]MCC2032628.1 hypothetical protein [Microbacterium allomyrinae]
MITPVEVTGGRCGTAIVDIDRSTRLADATAVYAATLTALDGTQRLIAVKADEGPQRGNRIWVERAAYKGLPTSVLAERTLTYYGEGKADWGGGTSMDIVALERARGALHQFYPAPDRIRVALAVTALRESVEFLIELSALRTRGGGEGLPYAHRDIKPANWFLVERDGELRVVLGDFGFARLPGSDGDYVAEGVLAPEQRKVRGRRPTLPTVRTDLWGAGLAAWILLHGGSTPYVDGDAGRWETEGIDPHGESVRLELSPPSPADQKRVPAGEQARQALAHSVALLTATDGDDRLVRARELLPRLQALADEIGPLDASELEEYLRRTDPAPAAPLPPSLRTLIGLAPAADAARAPATPTTPPRRRPRALAGGVKRAVGAAARGARRGLALLRGLPLALAVVATVSGAALVLGWLQLMPIPDAAVDTLQQWIAAGLLGGIGVVLLVVSIIARAATPADDRTPAPWVWPMITGLLTGACLAALTTWGMGFPVTLSGAAVWAGAGLAAAGIHSRLARFLATRRRQSARPALFAAVAAAVIAAIAAASLLLPIATPVAAAVSSHVAETTATALVPGIPSDKPVFINPHAIAVNARGDVAIVDRVGINRDVVWIVPESRAAVPYAVLRTLSWAGGARTNALSDVPEPALDSTQSTLVQWAHGSDPAVRSVDALDFVDDDTLVLIGIDGVTLLDFARQPDGSVASTTTLLTDEVRTGEGPGRDGQILVIDDVAYVTGVTTQIAPDGGEQPTEQACEYTGEIEPEVWEISLTAPSTVDPMLRVRDDGTTCADDVATIYREDGELRQVATRPTAEGTVYISVNEEGPDADARVIDPVAPGAYMRDAVSDGTRLLVNESFCVYPLAADGTRPAEPAVQVRTVQDAEWPCADTALADAPEEDVCVDKAGRSPLITGVGYWQPLAQGGPDGAIYTAAPVAASCTASILKLAPDSDQWVAIGDVDVQSPQVHDYSLGDTAIMSATRPDFLNGSVVWYAPSLGRIKSGPTGTETSGLWEFNTLENRPYEVIIDGDLAAEGEQPAVTSIRYEMGTDSDGVSLLAVSGYRGGDYVSVRIPIEGLTDIEFADQKLFYARCGQIASFEARALSLLLRAQGVPGGERPTVTLTTDANTATGLTLFTEVSVGDPEAAPPCATPERGPIAAEDRVVGADVDIAPIAFEVEGTGDDGYRFLFAEASVFGDERVSRVRLADTVANAIATVGYDPEDPRHRDEVNEATGDLLAGDLLRRGLVATDVALRDDGTVALSTATARGTGPLLLIVNNRTITLDAGDREVTGVGWAEDELVITDGARGDVVLLDVTDALAQVAPPIVNLFAWVPISPAHTVRAP